MATLASISTESGDFSIGAVRDKLITHASPPISRACETISSKALCKKNVVRCQICRVNLPQIHESSQLYAIEMRSQ